MKERSTLSTLEIVFLVMAVVPNVIPHARPVDAAHAHAAVLFRLACTLIGVAGFVIVQIAKRGQPRQVATSPVPALTFDMGEAAPSGEIRVEYNSTRKDRWRCNQYVLWHHAPTTAALFLLPVFVWVPSLLWVGRYGAGTALTVLVGLTALWIAIVYVILAVEIHKAIPTPGAQRLCQAVLTSEGFRMTTPEKDRLTPWTDVTTVRPHQGDLYMWARSADGKTTGWYVPRAAFHNIEAADAFRNAVAILWMSRGQQWPDETVVAAIARV